MDGARRSRRFNFRYGVTWKIISVLELCKVKRRKRRAPLHYELRNS